jgi:hypothetical protein
MRLARRRSPIGRLDVGGADIVTLIPLYARWQQAPPPDYSASICNGRT